MFEAIGQPNHRGFAIKCLNDMNFQELMHGSTMHGGYFCQVSTRLQDLQFFTDKLFYHFQI